MEKVVPQRVVAADTVIAKGIVDAESAPVRPIGLRENRGYSTQHLVRLFRPGQIHWHTDAQFQPRQSKGFLF